MCSYRAIQEAIRRDHDYMVSPCWIADVKERMGITVLPAPNRLDLHYRANPCPPRWRWPIALAYLQLCGRLGDDD